MINDLVSVIVPVYNVEKYIEKCLNSIINQTYKNIEVIIVNDGSEDSSIEICKKIQIEDKRIKILNQKNAGLSAARNTGIKNASGKYICFIDSDDYVHEDYIKLLLENLIENNTDISICDFLYVDEQERFWNRKKKNNKIYSNIEAIRDLLVGTQDTEVMAWNKLYKLSLFRQNNIYFPEGKLHEDNFTTYKLYYYAKSISLIDNKLYYYLQRNNSIMGRKFDKKRLDILQAVKEMRTFLKEKNINLTEELDCYEGMIQITILNNMIRDKYNNEEREQLINSILINKAKYKKNKYINYKLKLLIMILQQKGIAYSKILLLFDIITNRRKNF